MASPAQRHAFKVLPCLFRARWLVSSHCWVTVHCLGGAHLRLRHPLEGVLLAGAPLPCTPAAGFVPLEIHTGRHRRRGAFSTPLPLCLFAFLPSHLALCSARPVLWPFMLQHCGSQIAVPGAAAAENPLEMQRTPQIRQRAGPGLLSSLALPAVAGGRPGLRATTLPDRKLWAVPAWPGFNPPKDNMTLFTSPGADGISQMVTTVSAGRGEAGSLGPCCVGNGLGAPQ